MTVPITVRMLPKGRLYGRPGYKMNPTSITIHNTANEQVGADAETHARYLEAGHRISWHFTSDHDSIVQHLPITEQAWHTGTNAGNTTSVGIEICEYPRTPDGRLRQAKATENAAWLAAKLMRENPGIKSVRTHQSWSGKYCPRDLIPTWRGFLAKVQAYRTDSMRRRITASTVIRLRPGGLVIARVNPGDLVTQLGAPFKATVGGNVYTFVKVRRRLLVGYTLAKYLREE